MSSTTLMNSLMVQHLDSEDTLAIQILLDTDADATCIIDCFDNTPLHKAASKGLSDIVSILLAKGADLKARNIHGDTAFTSALKCGHLDVCKMLLDAGGEMDHFVILGLTPLMFAVRNNRRDIVNFLLANTSCVNETNKGGHTALFEACGCGRADLADGLLKAGAVHRSFDIHGQTPLLLAVRKGHTGCVKVLLQHGADPYQKGKAWYESRWVTMSPMYVALLSGLLDVVKLLWATMAYTESDLFRYTKDADLLRRLQEKNSDIMEWMFNNSRSPLSLTSLSHRVISIAVGYTSNRLPRLKSLGLPIVIQNRLISQNIFDGKSH